MRLQDIEGFHKRTRRYKRAEGHRFFGKIETWSS